MAELGILRAAGDVDGDVNVNGTSRLAFAFRLPSTPR
jgi:hypothetical protein